MKYSKLKGHPGLRLAVTAIVLTCALATGTVSAHTNSKSSPPYGGHRHTDLFSGTEGRDHMYGRRGDDQLIGNGGNDLLRGGPGNDYIHGSEGYDECYGGYGNDIIVYCEWVRDVDQPWLNRG